MIISYTPTNYTGAYNNNNDKIILQMLNKWALHFDTMFSTRK